MITKPFYYNFTKGAVELFNKSFYSMPASQPGLMKQDIFDILFQNFYVSSDRVKNQKLTKLFHKFNFQKMNKKEMREFLKEIDVFYKNYLIKKRKSNINSDF